MSDEGKYRRGVGVMLLNRDGKVFVGARIDNTDEAWQMPQGGIDEGEDEWAAALRELEEETGIPPHDQHPSGLVAESAFAASHMRTRPPA